MWLLHMGLFMSLLKLEVLLNHFSWDREKENNNLILKSSCLIACLEEGSLALSLEFRENLNKKRFKDWTENSLFSMLGELLDYL